MISRLVSATLAGAGAFDIRRTATKTRVRGLLAVEFAKRRRLVAPDQDLVDDGQTQVQ